jgi:hypothetical protein
MGQGGDSDSEYLNDGGSSNYSGLSKYQDDSHADGRIMMNSHRKS